MAESICLNPAPFLYMGRNTVRQGVCWLGWSASSLALRTRARRLTLCLCTDAQPPEDMYLCRAALLIDGKTERVFSLRGDMDLSAALDGAEHEVMLVRLSEAAFGALGVRGIVSDGPALPLEKPRRRIEFIGDSITCGYGVEADASDTFRTDTENALAAYAVRTARALGAGYSLVAWSGIGLISDWVPADAVRPETAILMPRLYPEHSLRLSERLGIDLGKHDFASDPADLAVINLGTNDQSWVRGIPDREADFERAYGAFLDRVHACRPGAALLCTLGIMGTELCPAVSRALEAFRGRCPDAKAAFFALPEQDARDGMGADGHPSPATQEKAAALLTERIRSFMGW